MISHQTSSGPCGQPSCRPQKPSNKPWEQGRLSSTTPPSHHLSPAPSTQGDISQSKLNVLGVYPKYEPGRTDRRWKGKGEGKKENPQALVLHPSHESGEFPAVRSRGRGFFLDGTIPCSHLFSSPRRRTKATVFLRSHLSRKEGDGPNASDTLRQAGCRGDRGVPGAGSCGFMDQEAPVCFLILSGTELPMSTGSRRDEIVKAIASPAAAVTSLMCRDVLVLGRRGGYHQPA